MGPPMSAQANHHYRVILRVPGTHSGVSESPWGLQRRKRLGMSLKWTSEGIEITAFGECSGITKEG